MLAKHFSKKCADWVSNRGYLGLNPELCHGTILATGLVGKEIDVIGYYEPVMKHLVF